MLTTGLLSLNIHEALTFDGAELCIRPDLFETAGGGTGTSGGGGGTTTGGSGAGGSQSTRTGGAPVGGSSAQSMDDGKFVGGGTHVGGGLFSGGPPPQQQQYHHQQQPLHQQQPYYGLSSQSYQSTQQQQPAASPTTSSQGGGSSSSPSSLVVGDMIEVRVWDPLPKEARRNLSSGSVGGFRKTRHSPPTSVAGMTASSQSTPFSADSGISSALNTPQPSKPAAIAAATAAVVTTALSSSTSSLPPRNTTSTGSTTQRPPPIPSSLGSLQYSEASLDLKGTDLSIDVSSAASSHEKEFSVDSKTIESPPPPTKTVVAAIPSHNSNNNNNSNPTTFPTSNNNAPNLPPVFPRGRASTGEHLPPKAMKRPTHHRRTQTPTWPSSTTSGIQPSPSLLSSNITTPDMMNAPPRPSTASAASSSVGLLPRSPKLIRHSREISDMTADTHIQLDLADLQPCESQDVEDVDDAWSKISATHRLRLSFVLRVTEKTLTSLKGNARTQVSMLRQVADLYSLSSYDMVTIHKIQAADREEVLGAVSADFVVVTIKDQFISRGDMHLFQKALIGTWIYEGQRLNETTRGVKAHARDIRHGNFSAKSGIVTDDTMITFRSRSARIFWLVQLSCEMWDYGSPYEHTYQPESICELYFDQWIRFIHKLFTKWKELEVTHSLTVVFFSRTFMTNGQNSSLNCRDVYGRSFEDHYKPIIENETHSDWDSLVVRIKEEFMKYPLEVGWNLTDRRPSNATQGNVLEAINVTLNLMQHHFLDRDLHRTGNSIVIVSPGCGVFEVDKELAGITYQRMMDNGIGSDMLSLGLPPLHIAPFFLYNNDYRTVETRGVDTSETYYEVPHWMHLAFINYDKDYDNLHHYGNGYNGKEKIVQAMQQSFGIEYEVVANGFLCRPRMDDETATTAPATAVTATSTAGPPQPSNSPPSSFSAIGNSAASPKKKLPKQERQLISGRNFRDILEACRPRVSGVKLPSSLILVLKMHQLVRDKETIRESRPEICTSKGKNTNESNEDEDNDNSYRSRDHNVPMREWGAVDFREFGVRSIKNKLNQTRTEVVGTRKLSFELFEKSEDSEIASSASSFASHMSSIFGMTCDWGLWGQADSPAHSKKAIQLQRSPSLEFEKITSYPRLDSDTALSEDSIISVESTSCSRSSTPGTESIEEIDSNASRAFRRERHVEQLRKIMATRDAHCLAPLPTQVDAIAETSLLRPETQISSDSELASTPKSGMLALNLRQRGKESKPSGGLGAALSQYSSSIGPSMANPESSRLSRTQSGSTLLLPAQAMSGASQFQQERSRAASPLFPSMTQFHERAGQLSVSPLLFAPITQPQPSEPPDTLRQEESGPVGLSRVMPLESRGFQSRDSTSSLGLITGSNHGEFSSGAIQPLIPASTLLDYRPKPKAAPRSPPPGGGNGRGKIKVSMSPPSGGILRERSSQSRLSARDHQSVPNKQALGSRRKKAFNPFRQSDEDRVLAKRSHNRRRWSHVFPAGEVEFKRHAGPSWNSLTSPAILPLSVDYFPSPQELRDESTFQFSQYAVTLGGLDQRHYSTHEELLLEMIRQRLSQDYQLVTSTAVEESESRAEIQRQASQYTARNMGKAHRGASGRNSFFPSMPSVKHDASGTSKYLTMGHRIQSMTYNPLDDTINIVHYTKKSAQNDPANIYKYRFLLYSKTTEKYLKSIQTFKKYSDPYKWNKVDNLICGEEDRTMEVGMRFRRMMFGLIPERFKDVSAEQDYISKFLRLKEYLSKLREKDDSQTGLNIKIQSSAEQQFSGSDEVRRSRRGTSDSMIRFTVQLRKGKRDPFEWIEIAVDCTFDTARSYRIMFNWLVASSSKVETQVQLLHRRCTQYGLQLISFPHATVSRNLFIHPFIVPPIFSIRDKEKADQLETVLLQKDFVNDGIHLTDAQILECIDEGDEYDFPKYRSGRIKDIPSRQFVHRSGFVFVRKICDNNGWVILAVIENRRHVSREHNFKETVDSMLYELEEFIGSAPLQETDLKTKGSA